MLMGRYLDFPKGWRWVMLMAKPMGWQMSIEMAIRLVRRWGWPMG